MTQPAYKRVLLKLSGEALMGDDSYGINRATIERMVVLAALTPIVASIGGNAGTQTMAVAVRAIATDQLTDACGRDDGGIVCATAASGYQPARWSTALGDVSDRVSGSTSRS